MNETSITSHNIPSTSSTTTANRPRYNQPGDGSYLASHHSRPGDGDFLANGHFGRLSRGAAPNGFRRGRDGGYRDQWSNGGENGVHAGLGMRQLANGERQAGHSNGVGLSSLQNTSVIEVTPVNHNGGPLRPAQPRKLVPADLVQNRADLPDVARRDIADGSGDQPRPRSQQRELAATRGDQTSNVTSSLRQMPNVKLDPSAVTFIPTCAPSSPRSQEPTLQSRSSSPQISSRSDNERPNTARRGKADGRKADGRKADGRKADGRKANRSSPPGPISSRRAAFDQQTKLTNTVSRQSDGSAPRNLSVVKADAHVKKPGKEVKDDLMSRLTRGLKSSPFLECPIVRIRTMSTRCLIDAMQCFNAITPSQHIWSCLPPDRPPDSTAPRFTADAGMASSSKHYSACYTPFHLACIRDWSDRSLIEEAERSRAAGRDGEESQWRCPGCQKKRAERIAVYR